MSPRSFLIVAASVIAFSSALGGLISQEARKPKPTSGAQPPEPAARKSDPTARVTPASDKSAGAADASKPSHDNLGTDKALLGRLLKELQRSSRSFLYLRSVGYTQTDQEFEEIITKNNAIFRRTRIVRRDDQGNRQIPGWPGVSLTDEYKTRRK